MESMLWVFGATVVGVVAGAVLLHGVGRIGGGFAAACCRAPGLDLIVTWFTVLPWLLGAVFFGWWGVLGGVLGQVVGLTVWAWGHELSHRGTRSGPRIVKVLNALVGRPRNHAALWVTTLAVPVFWMVRVAELVAYPPLVWLVRFPRYKQGEWINVSRQKFRGLVGHDLVWCLYCDWMTGVWSLGTEMLRNVESFWCPIRFSDTNKCDNCSIDFPDVFGGWVPADKSMGDVTKVLEEKYKGKEQYSWFGHPDRGARAVDVTVEGARREGADGPGGG